MIFPMVRMFPIRPQPRENLLRGLFPDAARVVEHQLCRVDAVHLPVPAPEQDSGDFLGVVIVHLAAECLDVERAIFRRGRGCTRAILRIASPDRSNRRRGNRMVAA